MTTQPQPYPVRFRNLSVPEGALRDELREAFDRVLDHGMLIEGPEVSQFEADFSELCGTRYSVGVSSGTSALFLALAACGLGPGDEVITTPLSWIATLNAIHLTGATPVFVDIGADLNMDADLIEAAISERTRAILPVHFYGRMCDMDRIMDIAQRHGLRVIEDAAQVAGARLPSGPAGGFGDAAAFSLNPMKVLNGFGEAGMVTTNNKDIRDRIMSLRYLGTINKETCTTPSLNHKMDALQAALLGVSLRHLESNLAARRAIAEQYKARLSSHVTCPQWDGGESCVFFDYPILTERRDALLAHLRQKGIEAKLKHELLMPDHPAYAHLCHWELLAAREKVAQHLCLPIHEKLTSLEIDAVCGAVADFFGQ